MIATKSLSFAIGSKLEPGGLRTRIAIPVVMKNLILISALSFSAFAAEKPNWHESMRNLATKLTELIPDLNKPEVYTTPQEKAEIIKNSKKFLEFAHTVKDNSNPPTSDSLVPMISSQLKQQVEKSIEYMEAGQWSRGKHMLMDISRHCIACHTLKAGPTSPPMMEANFDRLSYSQRANYFAATRQFDKAIINFESLLADKEWARTHENEWNDSFMKLLAITIRVRDNPSLTLELISRFFDSDTYPKGLKKAAQVWRQHVKDWRNQVDRNQQTSNLSDIKKLIEQAENLQAKSTEPVALVLFLRASSSLHTFLTAKDQANNQTALLLAGRSAEGLKDQNFWNFSEHYYTKCRSINENSPEGKTCAEKLRLIWGNIDVSQN